MERTGIYESIAVFLGNDAAVLWLLVLSLLSSLVSLALHFRARNRMPGDRHGVGSRALPAAPAPISGVPPALVAAITAAVAAASGRGASDIRITRISPCAAGPSGFNTPVWGHADRLANRGR